MAPIGGPATATAALVAILGGFWVSTEDPSTSILSHATPDDHMASARAVGSLLEHSLVTPWLKVDDAAQSGATRQSESSSAAANAAFTDVPEVSAWSIDAVSYASSLWIFILVDACLAVFLGAVYVRRFLGEVLLVRLCECAGVALLVDASVSSTVLTPEPLADTAADPDCRPSMAVQPSGEAAASAEDVHATVDAAASADEQPSLDAAAPEPNVESAIAPSQLRRRTCTIEIPPSPLSSPLRDAPEAATPERCSGSRGAASRVMAPRGVQEWYAKRRTATSKMPASDAGEHSVGCGGEHASAAKKTTTGAKIALSFPTATTVAEHSPTGSSTGHSACKRPPRGVQEWLQRRQGPLVKPSSLEEAFVASTTGAGGQAGEKPISRGGC